MRFLGNASQEGRKPTAPREHALGALINMASTDDNRVQMWNDAGVRAVVVEGAAAGQPEMMREYALGALMKMANALPMFRKSSSFTSSGKIPRMSYALKTSSAFDIV